jgi:flavin-binding protein dodecin
MSMLKVIEVLAESDKSWEDAAQTAVARANETVRQRPLHLYQEHGSYDRKWKDQEVSH